MKLTIAFALIILSLTSFAQDNSPYSRYGLGDLAPNANVVTRGMASISAGYANRFNINYNNPASYSNFEAQKEPRTGKLAYGRVILDVGINFDTHTLIEPNTPNRFRSSDAIFSYVQLGIPLRKNWGLSLGIRPVSKVSYSINRFELLKDPVSGDTIENAITQFNGSGGTYLPTIGTGFGINLGSKTINKVSTSAKLSLGANVGYLFGNREISTLRSLIDDTLTYYSSEHTTNADFGNVFFNSGMQLEFVKSDEKNGSRIIRFGFSGNWEQKLHGNLDSIRRTFTRSSTGENIQIDSVYRKQRTPGDVIFPANYRAGFTIERVYNNLSGWMIGADFVTGKWSSFRYFGLQDSVHDSHMIQVGGQFYPRPRENYFSHVSYRFGLSYGKDYIKVDNDLPLLGFSFGIGLPLANLSRMSKQTTIINLAFEYNKRGNDDNKLKENLFRVSLGLNFSDVWFIKRKYD